MTVDYQVLITPLDETGRAYGTRVDVTKDFDMSAYVKKGGIGKISRELDQGNYDIGIFNYNSLAVNVNNSSGKFNEKRLDYRSIFPSIRDRAIIQVKFVDKDSNKTISYEGLLTDKATRQNPGIDTVPFVFLGLESIMQQVVVNAGTIINGMTFSEAFRAILDLPSITSILNYDGANINPEIDSKIDVGSAFDNLYTKTAVDQLLLASNSVLLIDESRNIIVKSRAPNSNTPHAFYLNDEQRRDNIYSIAKFNNGLQRMFNVVIIGGESFKNKTSIGIHNEQSKTAALNFLTSSAKREITANAILDEFAFPMDELLLTTSKANATGIEFLDKCTVDYKQIIRPEQGQFAPLYEIDSYDRSTYPKEIGGFKIDGRRVFKITGSFEAPSTFNITYRLRDTGEMTA